MNGLMVQVIAAFREFSANNREYATFKIVSKSSGDEEYKFYHTATGHLDFKTLKEANEFLIELNSATGGAVEIAEKITKAKLAEAKRSLNYWADLTAELSEKLEKLTGETS